MEELEAEPDGSHAIHSLKVCCSFLNRCFSFIENPEQSFEELALRTRCVGVRTKHLRGRSYFLVWCMKASMHPFSPFCADIHKTSKDPQKNIQLQRTFGTLYHIYQLEIPNNKLTEAMVYDCVSQKLRNECFEIILETDPHRNALSTTKSHKCNCRGTRFAKNKSKGRINNVKRCKPGKRNCRFGKTQSENWRKIKMGTDDQSKCLLWIQNIQNQFQPFMSCSFVQSSKRKRVLSNMSMTVTKCAKPLDQVALRELSSLKWRLVFILKHRNSIPGEANSMGLSFPCGLYACTELLSLF